MRIQTLTLLLACSAPLTLAAQQADFRREK